jgi:hypothetical protein
MNPRASPPHYAIRVEAVCLAAADTQGDRATSPAPDSVNCVNTVTLPGLDTGTVNRYPAAHAEDEAIA